MPIFNYVSCSNSYDCYFKHKKIDNMIITINSRNATTDVIEIPTIYPVELPVSGVGVGDVVTAIAALNSFVVS